MYDILIIITTILNIGFIVCIVNQILSGNKILKIILGILLFFSINTFSAMLGYYLHGLNLNRWYLLAGQLLFLALECFIFYKSKHCEPIVLKTMDSIQEKVWIVCFMALFFVLLFSTRNFMPIWGNVDEVVHMKISMQFRNILDGMSNPLYRKLGSMDLYINRYSYIWGYHYNSALLSKVFHIDVIYINHFIRCLSMTAFLTTPLLWIQAERKAIISTDICYIILMILFTENWHSFLNLGYTAQLFSLAIGHCIIAIICQTKQSNKINEYILLPILTLFCLISYILTGIFLLIFILFLFIWEKKWKNILMFFPYFLYMIPIPPIWNQLQFFLLRKGTIDEALTAESSLQKAPSVLWIVLGIFFIGIVGVHLFKKTIENKKYFLFVTVEMVTFIGIYYLYDNTSYMMYKVMISLFPLLILMVCFLIFNSMFKTTRKNLLYKGVGILALVGSVALLLKTDIAEISVDRIQSLYRSEAQLSKDEYNCVKKISDLDDTDGIAYIGMGGPTAGACFVILQKSPFTWYKPGIQWHYVNNFSVKDIFVSMMEKKATGEDLNKGIYVLMNENNTLDMDSFHTYGLFLQEEKEIFRSGNCLVKELHFKNMDIERISQDELIHSSNFTKQDIHLYGDVAVVNELDKNIIYKKQFKKNQNVFSIYLKGRSIHNSKYIVRLYNDDELVYEQNVSGFENEYLLNLDKDIICDKCEIEVEGKNFPDSIIIDNINFCCK